MEPNTQKPEQRIEQPPMESIVTKRTVALGMIVGILLGFFVGILVVQNTSLFKTPAPEPVATPAQKFGDEIVKFLDGFTQDNDIGAPRTVAMYPEEKLVLIHYPTSQESGTYGVIDYANYKFYKNIGGWDYGMSMTPTAFWGNDQLVVVYTEYVEGETAEKKNSKILITNFSGETTAEVYTLGPNDEVDEIYGQGKNITVTLKSLTSNERDSLKIDPVTLKLTHDF